MARHSVDPPPFPRAAQVIIWRNTFSRIGLPTSHFGHAALQLYENGKRHELISWWPSEGSGKHTAAQVGSGSRRLSIDATNEMSERAREGLKTGTFTANPNQARRDRSASIILDYRKEIGADAVALTDDRLWDALVDAGLDWMQLPDMTIPIAGLGEQHRWGLHMPSIAAWWKDWIPDQTYHMKSVDKNCAGAVKLGLTAGGASWFHKMPRAVIYSDPVTVEDYARTVAATVVQLNQQSDQIESDPRSAPGKLHDVWSHREWKSVSNLGWSKVRSHQVKKIDSAVVAYHRIRLQQDTFKTYGALVKLMTAICRHRRERASSARAPRILEIAGQVLYRVDLILRTQWGAPWHSHLVSALARNRAAMGYDDDD